MRIFGREGSTADLRPFVEIQLIGIEDLARRNRPISPGIKLFGRRTADLANRLVSVEVTMRDAEPLIEFMASGTEMPLIEVPATSWSYVVAVGKDEAKFKQEIP